MSYLAKNIRKLTRSQDDYKPTHNPRLDASSTAFNTLYSPQSLNGAADWPSVDGTLGFEQFFQISDEPESELMETWASLPSLLAPPQAQEHHSMYDPMAFAQDMTDGSWAATSPQDYSVLGMEDIQPTITLTQHDVYPSPTLSPSWAPYPGFSNTVSPAPVPPLYPNHIPSQDNKPWSAVSAVPGPYGAPCVNPMYDIFVPSVTIPQSHSSAEVGQRSPVSTCASTKPRPQSAARKTSSRAKKANGSTHPCPHCPRMFSRPYNLSSHIKTHSGDKPHACTYDGCTSAFLRPYDLARHERNHSGEKPFICSGCGEQFKRHEGLNRHQKSCC